MMKGLFALGVSFALSTAPPLANATISPIQANYGNVFPTLTEQSLSVARSADAAPWYTTFDLLTRSDVTLGALGLGAGSNGSFFGLTSIRIVTLDGGNVAFGTDSFSTNPFPSAVEAIAVANALPAGKYALEVNGSGDRISCTPYCGDAADFVVRLQVKPNANATPVAAVAASPIQAAYGNVFPTLTERNLLVARSGDSATWYVSFNLVATAHVKLGALGLGAGSNGSFFDLTSLRIVSLAGNHVEFGTDTFSANPFPDPIEALVTADSLPAGQYALEISGSGDRISCTPYCGDAADFVVRLQVSPVPEVTSSLQLALGLCLLPAFVYAATNRRVFSNASASRQSTAHAACCTANS